jgi:hypothetical protein
MLFSACRRDDGVPSWNAYALIPLVKDSLNLSDLVADSLLEADADGALRLVYANSLLDLDLVEEAASRPGSASAVCCRKYQVAPC